MKDVLTLMNECLDKPRAPVEDALITAVVQLANDVRWLSERCTMLEEHVSALQTGSKSGE